MARPASSTTRRCSPRATAATSWTATATGRWPRSSPTSTPAGTTSTSRSRTGSTTSTSAPSSAPRTRSWPARCTSSATGAGTGAGAMVTDRYQHVVHHEDVPALAAYLRDQPGGPVALWGIDNLPGSLHLETTEVPRRVCFLFGQEGPGLSEPAPRGLRRDVLDRAVRLDPVDQRLGRRRDRDARLGARARRPVRRRRLARLRPRPWTWPGARRRAWALGSVMPIATHEKYAEMLDTAQKGNYAFPAINVSSSQTLNAALQGFAEAGSDGIVQVSTGRRGVPLRAQHQEHGDRLGRLRGVRARGGEELPGQHRAAHRPLPQGQARRLRPAAARDLGGAGGARRAAAVPVAHVGRLGRAARREPPDRQGAAGDLPARRTSSSRSRSASSAARRTASRARSTRSSTRRPRTRSPPSRRSAPARTAAT